MIIVSKDRKAAVNTDRVISYYMSYLNIKVKTDGTTEQLATYPTYELAECAFMHMLKAIELSSKNGIYYMPQDNELLNRISQPKERYLNGKKTKGHGGS